MGNYAKTNVPAVVYRQKMSVLPTFSEQITTGAGHRINLTLNVDR